MSDQEYGLKTEEAPFGFDLPDEAFDTPEVVDHREPADEPQEDDLWAVNHEADEQTIKDALPPVGDYEVQLSAGPRTTKEVEGQKLPDQRYFGVGVRYVDGKDHRARIRFSICPRKFIKENGKTYWAYLMYVSVGKAFLAINKRKHESYDELEEWLTTVPVKARITHTQDNDYMTVEIKGSYSEVPF